MCFTEVDKKAKLQQQQLNQKSNIKLLARAGNRTRDAGLMRYLWATETT